MRAKGVNMKKWICLFLVMVLTLTAAVALAGARMPSLRGALTDEADVLSSAMSAAITEYAKDVDDETDMDLHVVFVHFLDGLDAQTYANRLYEASDLNNESILLLCAAGEDSFATAMGKEAEEKLGKQNLDNLMYTSSAFAEHIARQEYDAAMGKYLTAFNDLINKRFDEGVKLPAAVAAAAGQQNQTEAVQPSGLGSLWSQITSGVESGDSSSAFYMPDFWSETVQGVVDNSEHYNHYQREESSNGIGVGGWIILIILILIIFSQSHPATKAKRVYRSSGKKKPLGWLFLLFGIPTLVKFFRKD